MRKRLHLFVGQFWKIPIEIRVHHSVLLALALSLLLLPAGWVFGWLIAVIIHEAGHYMALKILKVPVNGIRFGITGAKIDAASLTDREELLSAAAGPAIGLLLSFVTAKIPFISLCAFAQSLFNLLPIYPMDGGRMFRILAVRVLGENVGESVCNVVNMLLPAGLFAAILYFYRTKCM